MDTLKNKAYMKFDYQSRYSDTPYYYDTKANRWIYGVGMPIAKDSSFVTHKLTQTDTLDSLALKYYNNPTFWWVIAGFNDMTDCFTPLLDKFTTIKIPNISAVHFKDLRS